MRRSPAFPLLVTLCMLFPFTLSVAGDRTDPLGGTGGGPINGSLQVRVVHDGSGDPFEGAFVMVGPYAGEPIPNNYGYTSATGEISFSHFNLQGPVSVTAGASGHSFLTLVSVDANDLVLPLKATSSQEPDYQVGDFVSGIDVDNGIFHSGDGNLDMAIVLPTLRLEDMMSFDIAGLMGPPEIIDILGQPYEVPSNFFLPQQWEVFVEIIKDHYYLYLPADDYTLTAMSGRIPLEALVEGGEMIDMLTALSWREIDILDITVSGNTNNADLTVDPDLIETVTLNLNNIPDNSAAWCISVGDLDDRAGLGRLVPLGITAFDCPTGSGPCSGSIDLTTTAAVGEFAGMTYFPVVAVDFLETNDLLVVTDRDPHPRNYSETLDTFFSALDLGYYTGVFTWNDVENPGNGSPDVDVQITRIEGGDTEEVYWEFVSPGDVLSVTPPILPPEAPAGPAAGDSLVWEQVELGLAYELPLFDFNAFALSDIVAHSSHLAIDQGVIAYMDPTGITDRETGSTFRLQTATPNPFTAGTTIHYELPAAAAVDLGIYTASGRVVTTLVHAWKQPGVHQVVWRGRDTGGRSVPAGLYLARLRVGDRIAHRSLILLK